MVKSNGQPSDQNGQNGNHASNGVNGGKAPQRRSIGGWGAPGFARYAHLVGWGMKIPETVVTNFDLEAVVDTTDEWIQKGTGIKERRIAGERESVVTLGFEAARAALRRAEMLPSELELIIVATSTSEDIYPSSASKIQNLLGATKAGAFDLSAACSGFVYALNMAAQAIRSGSIQKALIVGAEVNSRVMDRSDRTTCILFGDGAGAVVLEGRSEPGGLLSCVLGSDGSGADLLGIPTAGYSTMPDGKLLHKLHMNGREVFRFATHIIPESINVVLEQAGLKLDDVKLIVPHQANQRILNAAARNLDIPEEMFYSNLAKYGNTSAASIPIALCEAEREGRLKPNDNIILVGFGGGLTWAAVALQWLSIPVKQSRGLTERITQTRHEVEYVAAFWRTRAMRAYRRVESLMKGPVTEKEEPPRKAGSKPERKSAVSENGHQPVEEHDNKVEKVRR